MTPTFARTDTSFLILSIILKDKKICTWEVLIISHILYIQIGSIWYMDTGVRDLELHILRLILPRI